MGEYVAEQSYLDSYLKLLEFAVSLLFVCLMALTRFCTQLPVLLHSAACHVPLSLADIECGVVFGVVTPK